MGVYIYVYICVSIQTYIYIYIAHRHCVEILHYAIYFSLGGFIATAMQSRIAMRLNC